MTTPGIGLSLDERWEANQPECGEDICVGCDQCLGCPNVCPDDLSGYHMFANSSGDIRLIFTAA